MKIYKKALNILVYSRKRFVRYYNFSGSLINSQPFQLCRFCIKTSLYAIKQELRKEKKVNREVTRKFQLKNF